MRKARLLFCALLCAAALGRAQAAPLLATRADDKAVDHARQLIGKGSLDAALQMLDAAEARPGNSARQVAEIASLRAAALLALPATPERQALADEALVQLFHHDPPALALQLSSAAVQARAQSLRAARTLLLHERVAVARSDRPLLISARIAGPRAAGARIALRYRVEPEAADQSGSDEEYVAVPLEQQRNGAFEAYLRPGIGGMPRGGERVLRYYLEANGPAGEPLDANGSMRDPIRAQLTGRGAAPAGTPLTVDEGAIRAAPAQVPARPWYRRWEIVGPVGGALVASAVAAAVLLHPKPQPTMGSLGKVDLP